MLLRYLVVAVLFTYHFCDIDFLNLDLALCVWMLLIKRGLHCMVGLRKEPVVWRILLQKVHSSYKAMIIAHEFVDVLCCRSDECI
jgi:hypothetical protein